MKEKLKKQYKYFRDVHLDKYVFDTKDIFINFFKNITYALGKDLKLIECELHDSYTNIKITSIDEFYEILRTLDSYYYFSIFIQSDTNSFYFKVHDLENIHFKTKMYIASNDIETIKDIEKKISIELKNSLNKFRFISNPIFQLTGSALIATMIYIGTGAFNEFPTTLPQLYNQVFFWGIIIFSTLIPFAIEMIFLPKIKIKMRESLRGRFNKFMMENKSAIYISFFFCIVSLLLSVII